MQGFTYIPVKTMQNETKHLSSFASIVPSGTIEAKEDKKKNGNYSGTTIKEEKVRKSKKMYTFAPWKKW
jgi:hypothetical protein